MPQKLTANNYDQLASIDGGYFWFQGRFLWVQDTIKRFAGFFESVSLEYADLGCGTGELSRHLKKSFSFQKTLLVDGHEFQINPSEKNSDDEFMHLDLEGRFDLKGQFDVITCLDVLEHLKDTQPCLQSVRNHLKTNGIFVATVPAFSFLFSAWDHLWGHHRRYSKKDLIREFELNGYEVVFASYFWSILFPVAVLRKVRGGSETEFPKVRKFVNQLLVTASRFELWISRYIKLPFGTSVILVAKKKV